MQCFSTDACTSNVRGDFTRASPRNCKQTWDLKGDKGTALLRKLNCKQTVIQVPLSPF